MMGDSFVPTESKDPIPYDATFTGPVRVRSCTDIFWLVFFCIFLIAWGVIGIYAFSQGSTAKLLAPLDTYGHRCGIDAEVRDKPYLVFMDIGKCIKRRTFTGCATPQVCVKQCPQKTIEIEKKLTSNPGAFEALKEHMVCSVDVTSLDQALTHIRNQKCASYVIHATPVLGRCIHFVSTSEAVGVMMRKESQFNEKNISDIMKSVGEAEQLSSQFVLSLAQSKWYLIGGLIVAVLLCLGYVLLLRWLVAPVVWGSIAFLLAALLFSLYPCYKKYTHVKAQQDPNEPPGPWLVGMIVIAVVFVVVLLLVIFLRKRIILAIALIREGSKAVIAIKSTIFFPVLPGLFQVVIIAFFLSIILHLISLGQPVYLTKNLVNDTSCVCSLYNNDSQACDPAAFANQCHDISNPELPCYTATCSFVGLDVGGAPAVMQAFNVFGFYWAMLFISAVADMILAGTFATWYWTFKKNDLPFSTLSNAISRTVRYHLGTAAFGSLIITIVKALRQILNMAKKMENSDNAAARFCLTCIKCIFSCVEEILKFISKNAYIMCAVHGKNFCTSARDAFSLLMRNIVNVVILDQVTSFIFALSKLLISILVGAASYFILQSRWVLKSGHEEANFVFLPVVILVIATYLIATIFFKVYAIAVDTIFICFLEDKERNDGTPERPYYMSKKLMKILGKDDKEQKNP